MVRWSLPEELTRSQFLGLIAGRDVPNIEPGGASGVAPPEHPHANRAYRPQGHP